jgi:hypothetical protein
MDCDTSSTSTADNTMDNAMGVIGIPSLDRARPITRKARPTVRKQQRSRLALRRAVDRLARETKRTTPNLTIRITNTMDFDKMDLEEMDLDDMNSVWQLLPASSIHHHHHDQYHPSATQLIFPNQVLIKTPVADRWNDEEENDRNEVEDPNSI